MEVIAISNQKGGVGKTTTTHQLAGVLAEAGRRVLIVDADPQGSLTQGLFGPNLFYGIGPGDPSILALFDSEGSAPLPSQLILDTPIPGVSILAGSAALASHNVTDPWAADRDRQDCLRSFAEEARDLGRFDVALIDCPPNLQLCTWAALLAANWIVVPVQPEDYGVQGLSVVNGWVELIRSGPNPGLGLLGYLLTMTANEAIHRDYEAILREGYGADVFAARVPRSTDYKAAVAARRTISQTKPKGAAAKAMRAVAEELMARIEARRVVVPAMEEVA